jgi:flagellar hook-basal body complex protein FliE
MNPISKITAPPLIPLPGDGGEKAAGPSFSKMLSEAIDQVGNLQRESDVQLRQLLNGDSVDLHRVLLAGEKAGLASQFMMSVRNKVVDAYQEIMRMQV